MSIRYRAVLFDLFGTLALFKEQAPTLNVAGTRWRSTMDWLHQQLSDELPDVAVDAFAAAMKMVTEEIVRARPPEYHEVLSQERFRRALARVGVEGDLAAEVGHRLALRHMEHLFSRAYMPATHGALLRALAPRYAIGLVSNFDHAPTARRLLTENAIDDLLGATIISADFGRRKPHPSIFHAALDAIGVAAGDALYVGDTVFDDVCGARGAGMDVVWINPTDVALPAGADEPTYTVRRLTDIATLLGVALD